MGKKNKGKQPERTPQENEQIQAILADYNGLAANLAESRNEEQVENALSPVFDMSETAQVGLLKALAKEHTTPAADIVLAVNTYAPIKEVRKEARRSLIQLEGSNTYPEWTIPSVMSLSDIVGLDAFSDFEGDEEDYEDDEEFDDGENIIEHFLRHWGQGDFELSYDLLTVNSPLKEGLSREEWTARRQAWAEEAGLNTDSIKVDVGYTLEADDEDVPDELLESDIEELDAFWSIELKDVLSNSVPELPTATITLPATGRHWFWASYTFLTEDGELRIHSIRDKGAEVLQLSNDEVEERLDEIAQELQAMSEALSKDEGDIEEDEDEIDNDEFEDEEDEELEVDLDEVMWFSKQALHYGDSLIAHPPTKEDVYVSLAQQATTIGDTERAAAYYTIAVERLPEERGDMLRALSYTYSILADEDAEEHDFEEYMEEEENTVAEDYISRYASLAEKVARDAIAADNSFPNYILLADILFKQNNRLNEIKTLFEQTEAIASNSEEKASIEIGRARISRMENNPEEALVHFQKALDIDATFPGIWNSIGELQLSLEQPDAAEESFLKSIEVSPTVTGAYADLATLYINQNNEEAALRVLEQGIDANPRAADLNTALAMLYLSKDDLQKAERFIEVAEEIDPDLELVVAVRQIIDLKKLQAQMSQLPTNSKQNKSKKRR